MMPNKSLTFLIWTSVLAPFAWPQATELVPVVSKQASRLADLPGEFLRANVERRVIERGRIETRLGARFGLMLLGKWRDWIFARTCLHCGIFFFLWPVAIRPVDAALNGALPADCGALFHSIPSAPMTYSLSRTPPRGNVFRGRLLRIVRQIFSAIFKAGILPNKSQGHIANRPVALLGDQEIR